MIMAVILVICHRSSRLLNVQNPHTLDLVIGASSKKSTNYFPMLSIFYEYGHLITGMRCFVFVLIHCVCPID